MADCLEVDPDRRPDATRALEHPFITTASPLRTLAPLIKAARDQIKRDRQAT